VVADGSTAHAKAGDYQAGLLVELEKGPETAIMQISADHLLDDAETTFGRIIPA